MRQLSVVICGNSAATSSNTASHSGIPCRRALDFVALVTCRRPWSRACSNA